MKNIISIELKNVGYKICKLDLIIVLVLNLKESEQ